MSHIEDTPTEQVKVPDKFCVLEDAPVNSHFVVLPMPGEPNYTICQTPAGEVPVPPDDYGLTLPLLGEVKKKGPHSYVAIQRDDPYGKPPLIRSTAVECIKDFKKHFHGERE